MKERNELKNKDRFLSAIGFITVLPTGNSYKYTAWGMTAFFPVAGLVVGCLLAVFDICALSLWNRNVAAVLDVVFLIAITGAFHLDGLADTADGFFSHRSVERMLEIMKDSRIGSMGVVALISILALKCTGFMEFPDKGLQRALYLILIPAYARSCLVFGIRFLPYGRPDGTGKGHFEKPLGLKDFIWIGVPVALSFLTGVAAFKLNLAFILIVSGFLLYFRKKTGFITGDMLGAMVEAGEAVLILALAI